MFLTARCVTFIDGELRIYLSISLTLQ